MMAKASDQPDGRPRKGRSAKAEARTTGPKPPAPANRKVSAKTRAARRATPAPVAPQIRTRAVTGRARAPAPAVQHFSEDLANVRIAVTTIGDVLLNAADRYPDTPALVFPDREITYAELARNALRRARGLRPWVCAAATTSAS